jgi:hypothetical protein
MSNLKVQGNASGTGTTTLQSGNTASSVTFSLPIADGTSGQAITTDGAGVLSFASVGTDASNITSGTLAVARGGTGVTSSTGSTSVVLSTSPTITTPTITGYTESVVAIGTVTTAHTLSLASGTVQTVTLTTAVGCTFTMPTATSGTSFILRITQAALGLGTATFTGVKWSGGTAPTGGNANSVDVYTYTIIKTANSTYTVLANQTQYK